MNSYFSTDWGAMTLQDWLGLIVTVVVFLLMVALYVLVLHPANKEKLEAQRYIPFDDEHVPEEKSKKKKSPEEQQ